MEGDWKSEWLNILTMSEGSHSHQLDRVSPAVRHHQAGAFVALAEISRLTDSAQLVRISTECSSQFPPGILAAPRVKDCQCQLL